MKKAILPVLLLAGVSSASWAVVNNKIPLIGDANSTEVAISEMTMPGEMHFLAQEETKKPQEGESNSKAKEAKDIADMFKRPGESKNEDELARLKAELKAVEAKAKELAAAEKARKAAEAKRLAQEKLKREAEAREFAEALKRAAELEAKKQAAQEQAEEAKRAAMKEAEKALRSVKETPENATDSEGVAEAQSQAIPVVDVMPGKFAPVHPFPVQRYTYPDTIGYAPGFMGYNQQPVGVQYKRTHAPRLRSRLGMQPYHQGPGSHGPSFWQMQNRRP